MKRLALLVILVCTLVACTPTTASAAPTVQATLVTPATPLTYAWVMVHDWSAWGVQIGPKNDGSGLHVAVYAWRDCGSSSCTWDTFTETEPLAPGSAHTYSIVYAADGWHLQVDGRDQAVFNVGGPSGALVQINTTGEKTAA